MRGTERSRDTNQQQETKRGSCQAGADNAIGAQSRQDGLS